MKSVKINEDICWVGGIDWGLRSFHGYLTQRGSTYNAYLIMDDKITLVDTVKHYMYDEMIERISEIVDPSDIDYVVANHVEMDHSGGLPRLVEVAEDAVILTSPKGEKGLESQFNTEKWNIRTVKTGDTVSIGKRDLSFVQVPMVHWPDSMVTYSEMDSVLFSNDAFGQHIATSERFDDQCSLGVVLEEARKYYANIVLPYGKQVQKALEALSGLKIDLIAPSHGIIWRRHIDTIIKEYEKWCTNETENRAIIIYETMWGSTGKLAYCIADAFNSSDIPCRIVDLEKDHISDIMTDLVISTYICVGSPTLNNGIMPDVSAFLTYMKGLAPKNRTGLAFGSYGWGGQSVGLIEDVLNECGFDLMESIRCKYVPDKDTLSSIKSDVISQLTTTGD